MRSARGFMVLAVLSLFLAGSVSAGETPRSKSKTGKNEDPKAESSKAAAAKPAPKPKTGNPAARSAAKPAAKPAARAAAPKPQSSAADEPPPLRPMPATSGTLGLFTLETGDNLPKKAVSFSTYVNKYSREPGSASFVDVGWSLGYGITDWVNAYLVFEPHRHVHVSRPGRLSFNASQANPQFGTTMYRGLTPTPGSRPGYIEDHPFVGRNGGGVGEFVLGLKWGLLQERRGNPVSLSVRTDFIIPTQTQLTDLLNNQTQNGVFDFNVGTAISKKLGRMFVGTFNWNYRFTQDPEFSGVKALIRADQMRFGFGFLAFPEKRVQLMSEYNGLVYVGNETPNTTFGARDPFEIISGVRLYPWRNVGLDLGYRNVANLKAHGDRNGFVVKLGMVHWPEAKKPMNRPPVAACSVEKSSVVTGSGETIEVRVAATDADGDPVTYSWQASGGRIEGSGASVRWNPANASPGSYTITATVNDGMSGTASCAVDVRLEPRPNRAPTVSCAAERSSVLIGERVRFNARASDPDGDSLNYTWQANAGQIVGSGQSVQLDTTGLAAGRYTVTARVDDGRGGAADCSADVNVQPPPPPPQASKVNECFFRQGSARVDNVCKRILDDVALRLQNEPRARVVVVGYADPRESRPERLAAQRGESARTYLGEKGVAASRVDVRSAGGQTGAGRQNRRLDVIWVPEGATF